MPSLSFIKRNYGTPTVGESHKIESDMIMEATWYNDIASRTGYLYDWYHDDNKTTLNDLDSINDKKKIPVEIKYLKHENQTMSKDEVSFHIQLKPKQKCNVPYYDEFFKNRYGSKWPCGLYIDIPDKDGIYNRWLVVDSANINDAQFVTFEILRCDFIIQYVFDGVKYNVPAVLRSQNSYNRITVA